MSALSTPGGGGTTAQSKPTSGKQKYQKLDINSLYCANRNESAEPSSVKSQLSRKHGMQSLGKVPSARRPPANLPSLKTETGQDPNSNSISATTTSTSTTSVCSAQTVTTSVSSSVVAGSGGWVPLPPPSSAHFRTEFPSLEAAAQPSHRSTDNTPQTQLRPQTEGNWMCGGTAGARADGAASPAAAPASSPASQQTPAFRAILPSFLMKGSSSGGLGIGNLSSLRENRPAPPTGSSSRAPPPRQPQRPVEPITARPILRDDQISSLDDIARDAGWAQHDDIIDYDQKLDFSDGESTPAPSSKTSKQTSNKSTVDSERADGKIHDAGDEDQIWAERRQKQSNEVAAAVARARQRKEEEQRRQMRDGAPPPKERDREDKDRTDRDRPDVRDKERTDIRDRDNRDKDRLDSRERDNRERFDDRDRGYDNRERDRDRDWNRDNRDSRNRVDSRDRPDNMDKDRSDRDNRDSRDRQDRDRYDRDRERGDRDKMDRDRDRDRDFRDRDYARDRDASNPAFSKTFQANIPPRFLKQQQSRQQDEPRAGGWPFAGKGRDGRDNRDNRDGRDGGGARRPEPASYGAPRHAPHNGRRSYSRDYSDREDDFRRDKENSTQQWRSEMQDYDRRDLDRQSSKESYKDHGEFKDRRHDGERKIESSMDHVSRTAADKLSEVFERKSSGLTEPFAVHSSHNAERRHTPPSNNTSQRQSLERDYGKTSWAEATRDDPPVYSAKSHDKFDSRKDSIDQFVKDSRSDESKASQHQTGDQPIHAQSAAASSFGSEAPQAQKYNQQVNPAPSSGAQSQTSISSISQTPYCDTQIHSKNILSSKPHDTSANIIQKQPEQITQQPIINKIYPPNLKPEKDFSETESVASKSSTDPVGITKITDKQSMESLHVASDSQKRSSISADEKRVDRFNNDQSNKMHVKEPIERKSSGSGSEKKGRGYGSSGYAIYNNRGWGRESRGRRSHRSSRSKNRASESDGSTDGAPNAERKERRRVPRSPRGPKKPDRAEDASRAMPPEQAQAVADPVENREPFAPRGQPSRRGRGGFQGASRPPAPAKRVTGYGPPNTKSPFSQANRAVKDGEEIKDGPPHDNRRDHRRGGPPGKGDGGRGRDRRPKGPTGAPSGEDENWETTSEHSEGGGPGRRRPDGARSHRGHGARNQNTGGRPNNRNQQGPKKDMADNKPADVTEAMSDLKITNKTDDVAEDGFQEVRNKRNAKDARGAPVKEEIGPKPSRSHSNQGMGRNNSNSRNSSEKPGPRGAVSSAGKPSQYDRPRQSHQSNLAPRFVKQRQKQQMGLATGFGPDNGAAPPPPPVNAWDKPISQTLRGNVEEQPEVAENKATPPNQRVTPPESCADAKPAPCAPDKAGVLDGSTPPVETIIFENTNYKTPPAEALKAKYQQSVNAVKTQGEGDIPNEVDARSLAFNGEVRAPPRTIQELIDTGRTANEGETLGLPMSFESAQKEDSSDMKLDFAFDSDLGQLTEDKSGKSLGLPRGAHMSTSSTISPLAADLDLKIASVKKVWEMPAVVEGAAEELQFAAFEETAACEPGPPNVCKVKPTQQLQSPPPQAYNHVGYQSGYGQLSVSSPPAVIFNSSQQILGSSQQLPQQGGLYGAFLDQSRGQFGGFPYGAGSAAPYNYQPPPDIFQNQYRMAAAAGGGAAFGQSGQLGNSPNTMLISSTSNSLMSATVKPSSQQIGAIGSKQGAVGAVGAVGVGGVNYQQQYLGYSAEQYSLGGLLPRPAPPASSYYSYQDLNMNMNMSMLPVTRINAPIGWQTAGAQYGLQFPQPAQSPAFNSQYLSSQHLSSQLQAAAAAAAVQQMQQQQQYRAPMQQQYAPQPRPPPQQQQQQQLKSPLHEHSNGFGLCEAASPTPKGAPAMKMKPPHSPPHHKFAHPPPPHTPHQHHHQQHQQHQHPHHQQMVNMGGNRGNSGSLNRGQVPRYPAPIQRPPAAPYRPRHQHPRPPTYYPPRNGGGGNNGGSGAAEAVDTAADAVEPEAPGAPEPAPIDAKAD